MGDAPKVVSLRGGNIPAPGTPVSSVVEAAEKLLEAARAGEITSFAAAYQHADDCTSSCVVGETGRGTIGMLEVVKFGLCRRDLEP